MNQMQRGQLLERERSFLIFRMESVKEMPFFLWMLGVLMWHWEFPPQRKPAWEWDQQRRAQPRESWKDGVGVTWVTTSDADSTPELPVKWANQFIIVYGHLSQDVTCGPKHPNWWTPTHPSISVYRHLIHDAFPVPSVWERGTPSLQALAVTLDYESVSTWLSALPDWALRKQTLCIVFTASQGQVQCLARICCLNEQMSPVELVGRIERGTNLTLWWSIRERFSFAFSFPLTLQHHPQRSFSLTRLWIACAWGSYLQLAISQRTKVLEW